MLKHLTNYLYLYFSFPDSTGLSLLNDVSTKEELMEEIESIDRSMAAALCNISRRVPFQEPQYPLMRDLIGLVALLGSVRFSRLSRSDTLSTFLFILLVKTFSPFAIL